MGIVHCLECDTRVIAVEVAILNKVFDGVHDLGERQHILHIEALFFVPSSGPQPAPAVLPTLQTSQGETNLCIDADSLLTIDERYV